MTIAALARPVPERISPFLGFRQEAPVEFLPAGIGSFDRLLGGCPRGRVSEISGPASSGRTSLLHKILAAAGERGEYCALADAAGSFDPVTAEASGVSLDTLVWVRCGGNIEHAMKAADLLLHSGGFGVVALDLCGLEARHARRIPAAYWHRFRRAVENSSAAFVVVGEEPWAGSCASVSATMSRVEARFTGRNPRYLLEGATYQAAARKPFRPGEASFDVEALHAA